MGTSLGTVVGLIEGLSTLVSSSSLSNFPTTGRTGALYLATDTNMLYVWDGSAYVTILTSGTVFTFVDVVF